MRLGEYLKKEGITPQEFAPKIGVKWGAIYRYNSGLRVPTKEIMQKIFDATNGEVTPNDILGIPPQDGEECTYA